MSSCKVHYFNRQVALVVTNLLPLQTELLAGSNMHQIVCRQITNVMFDEMKYILSYGSTDNASVKFTTTDAGRNVRLLPVYTFEDAYATRQFHRQ